MSYEVLARKWRPQTFDDVVGQPAVVETLKRALSQDRVAHAFLFTGSRGIGKTSVARLMAKAICCETGVTATPCGTCVHCKEISTSRAVDVVEIDGASHTGVDDIRDLRNATRFQPQSCRAKVFIIDEVHMLSTSAFNALLKTLEEPPPHVKFIFATTEPHKIPVTILSRCQRYDFQRITSATICDRLRHVLAQENLTIEDRGLALIARAAEGGMRDALSLTDQVISFAGSPATAEHVRDALGIIDRRTVVDLTHAVVARDAKGALTLLQSVYESGYNLLELADKLAFELRHLNIAKAAGSIVGFADLSPEELTAIDERAADASPKDLQRLFQAMLDAQEKIFESENERLAFELTLIQLCNRPPVMESMAISEALVRLDALAKGRPVPPLAQAASSPAAEIVREAVQQKSAPSKRQSTPRLEKTVKAPAVEAGKPSSGQSKRNEQAKPRVKTEAKVPEPKPEPKPAPKLQTAEEPSSRVKESAPPVMAAAAVEVAQREQPRTGPGTEPSPEEAPEPTRSTPASLREQVTFSLDGPLSLEGIDEAWLKFVMEVSRNAQRLGGTLTHGRYLGLINSDGKNVVRVAFDKQVHVEDMTRHSAHAAIGHALKNFAKPCILEVVESGDERPPTIAEAEDAALLALQSALEEHAQAHPVVQRAVEIFGGEIREVRQGNDR